MVVLTCALLLDERHFNRVMKLPLKHLYTEVEFILQVWYMQSARLVSREGMDDCKPSIATRHLKMGQNEFQTPLWYVHLGSWNVKVNNRERQRRYLQKLWQLHHVHPCNATVRSISVNKARVLVITHVKITGP